MEDIKNLKTQLLSLQQHLDKVMQERDVLRMANTKKFNSIVRLQKRLAAITEKKEAYNEQSH